MLVKGDVYYDSETEKEYAIVEDTEKQSRYDDESDRIIIRYKNEEKEVRTDRGTVNNHDRIGYVRDIVPDMVTRNISKDTLIRRWATAVQPLSR